MLTWTQLGTDVSMVGAGRMEVGVRSRKTLRRQSIQTHLLYKVTLGEWRDKKDLLQIAQPGVTGKGQGTVEETKSKVGGKQEREQRGSCPNRFMALGYTAR